MSRDPVERFWSHVRRGVLDECWPWESATDRDGYGVFTVYPGQLGAEKKQQLRAHRVAFYLTYGYWPQPQALHGCDNPPCCNAECAAQHVHEGTNSLNQQEAVRRGRHVAHAAEQNSRAKLTNAQARDIRQRAGNGESQVSLAVEYGVSRRLINLIVHGRRYAAA